MRRISAVVVVAVSLVLPLAACGGGGSGADTAKVSAQLQKGGLAKPEADCIAGALDKAGLKLEDYRRFATGKGPNLKDPKLRTYARQVTRCFTDLPTTTGG